MLQLTPLRKSFLCAFIFSTVITSAYAQSKQDLDSHRAKWGVTAAVDEIKNPYAYNTALIDTGRVLYQKACAVCHGDKGKGDGVASAGLPVRPADHTSGLVQAQSDGVLFYELTNGHAPMPAFKTVFTEQQRWALVNYIRTLAKIKPALAKAKK